jgi:hypothetical protein
VGVSTNDINSFGIQQRENKQERLQTEEGRNKEMKKRTKLTKKEERMFQAEKWKAEHRRTRIENNGRKKRKCSP